MEAMVQLRALSANTGANVQHVQYQSTILPFYGQFRCRVTEIRSIQEKNDNIQFRGEI